MPYVPELVDRGKNFDYRNYSVFLETLNTAETTYDIFKVLKHLALSAGYEKFIVLRLPGDAAWTLAEIVVVTNWDPELIRAYDAKGLFAASPLIARLRESVLPVSFDYAKIQTERTDDTAQTATELFADFGIKNGVCLSVADKAGRRGAILFAGNRPPMSQEEIMSLSFISTHVYELLMNFEGMGAKQKDQLTERERECIYWTAAGKTSSEVGTILNISENTVNHYLSSAALKLDAVNKAHTVAKAIRLGILDR